MKKVLLSFIVLIGLLWVSCTKPPDYPVEPVIEFMSVNKTVINTAVPDTLVFLISFTDGDGDLGFEDNSTTIFLYDQRFPDSVGIAVGLATPVVPEQGANNGISGEITFIVRTGNTLTSPFPDALCSPPTDEDCPNGFPCNYNQTLIYSIELEDRAGNRSNRIETTPITFQCEA